MIYLGKNQDGRLHVTHFLSPAMNNAESMQTNAHAFSSVGDAHYSVVIQHRCN